MLPAKLRRQIPIWIPLLTGLLFLGVIGGIFDVDASTNVFKTGIALGTIFGIINLWMAYMAYKKNVYI